LLQTAQRQRRCQTAGVRRAWPSPGSWSQRTAKQQQPPATSTLLTPFPPANRPLQTVPFHSGFPMLRATTSPEFGTITPRLPSHGGGQPNCTIGKISFCGDGVEPSMINQYSSWPLLRQVLHVVISNRERSACHRQSWHAAGGNWDFQRRGPSLPPPILACKRWRLETRAHALTDSHLIVRHTHHHQHTGSSSGVKVLHTDHICILQFV